MHDDQLQKKNPHCTYWISSCIQNRKILFTIKNIYHFNKICKECENFILSSFSCSLKEKCPLHKNILDASNYLFLKSKKKCV